MISDRLSIINKLEISLERSVNCKFRWEENICFLVIFFCFNFLIGEILVFLFFLLSFLILLLEWGFLRVCLFEFFLWVFLKFLFLIDFSSPNNLLALSKIFWAIIFWKTIEHLAKSIEFWQNKVFNRFNTFLAAFLGVFFIRHFIKNF